LAICRFGANPVRERDAALTAARLPIPIGQL
jgi:hypothetical protein